VPRARRPRHAEALIAHLHNGARRELPPPRHRRSPFLQGVAFREQRLDHGNDVLRDVLPRTARRDGVVHGNDAPACRAGISATLKSVDWAADSVEPPRACR